jgi:predicted restriction endonuclease
MNLLRPVLPDHYAPLQATGRGNQGVYLTRVPLDFAKVLVELIGVEAHHLVSSVGSGVLLEGGLRDVAVGQVEWEEHIASEIRQDETMPETERDAIIVARRGQGRFKEEVLKIERRCRITGVDRIEHLRASHIKPWRDCEDHRQRLDGSNGLLLTPSIDHLFDRGFISFEGNGELLISPVAHLNSLKKMGINVDEVVKVGTFASVQKEYLEYHRDLVFLRANVHGLTFPP